MYTSFIYSDKSGIKSNPYIATTNRTLFKMIYKYELTQYDCKSFVVESLKIHPLGLSRYEDRRETLSDFAKAWQNKSGEMLYDWSSLADWGAFFSEYGKKYGLLREFRNNGII